MKFVLRVPPADSAFVGVDLILMQICEESMPEDISARNCIPESPNPEESSFRHFRIEVEGIRGADDFGEVRAIPCTRSADQSMRAGRAQSMGSCSNARARRAAIGVMLAALLMSVQVRTVATPPSQGFVTETRGPLQIIWNPEIGQSQVSPDVRGLIAKRIGEIIGQGATLANIVPCEVTDEEPFGRPDIVDSAYMVSLDGVIVSKPGSGETCQLKVDVLLSRRDLEFIAASTPRRSDWVSPQFESDVRGSDWPSESVGDRVLELVDEIGPVTTPVTAKVDEVIGSYWELTGKDPKEAGTLVVKIRSARSAWPGKSDDSSSRIEIDSRLKTYWIVHSAGSVLREKSIGTSIYYYTGLCVLVTDELPRRYLGFFDR